MDRLIDMWENFWARRDTRYVDRQRELFRRELQLIVVTEMVVDEIDIRRMPRQARISILMAELKRKEEREKKEKEEKEKLIAAYNRETVYVTDEEMKQLAALINE